MRVQSLFVDSERGIIMDKEARDHEFTETSTLESGREASDGGGSSKDRQHSKRSLPAIRDRDRSVLYVGEACPSGSPGGIAEREERQEGVQGRRDAKVRDGATSRCDSRIEHGESGAKKRAIGITPYGHYSSEEKELILASVERVQEMTEAPVKVILDHLGLPSTTYYRWQRRRATGSLSDRIASPQRRACPPIPQEIDSVCSYALEYPQIGYKRLTWQMIDDDVAYLKAYQVYEILKERDKLVEIYRRAAVENMLDSDSIARDLRFVVPYFSQQVAHIYRRKPAAGLIQKCHPGGICLPGVRKLLATVDGRLFPCERCNDANDRLCIGSVDDGVDINKVMKLIDDYSELCSDACQNCWAFRLCGICFVSAEGPDGLDRGRKLDACSGARDGYHDTLVFCHSILEENPNALDFLARIEIGVD